MNEACYDCITRSTVIKTDIRMGDFWGGRYVLDTKGVSAVIISSEKGKELFDSVAHKFYFDRADFNEIISAQSYKKVYNLDNNRRNSVLSMLSGDEGIDTVVRKHRRMLSLRTNVKRSLKSVLKHLPDSIYLRLKKQLR